ncbi:MAG: hypothetical protein WD607_02025 [Candidatus Paceibacterota bacterium]
MGQQQLLLIILVTIIVGLATVVAINTMQSAYDSANYDAIQQDILQAHAASMGYLQKPRMMGGGGGSYTGISLEAISLPEENDNGTYELGEVTANSFEIIGTSANNTFVLTATIEGDEIAWSETVPE